MYRLDREKLAALLRDRGLTLQRLARDAGISRQSLYQLLAGRSIFTAPFEKILRHLEVDLREIAAEPSPVDEILGAAPEGVRRAAMLLHEYARERGADLFLIGSRARGRTGVRADWDVAVFFPDRKTPRDFVTAKQRASDAAFPHRLDVVDLASAPAWFLRSVAADALRLCGSTDRARIFGSTPGKRRAA